MGKKISDDSKTSKKTMGIMLAMTDNIEWLVSSQTKQGECMGGDRKWTGSYNNPLWAAILRQPAQRQEIFLNW
jgi:hypothetical protein